MRVRISYGMEIEDVPEQAKEVGLNAVAALREAVERLEKAVSNIEESDQDYTLVLSMLVKIRQQLNNTDLALGDLGAILIGLNNYYNGENNVSEGRSTMDSSGNPTQQTKNTREG